MGVTAATAVFDANETIVTLALLEPNPINRCMGSLIVGFVSRVNHGVERVGELYLTTGVIVPTPGSLPRTCGRVWVYGGDPSPTPNRRGRSFTTTSEV